MSEAMHPAAPHHLPPFITAPGETDVLFTGSVIFLVLAVMGIGSLYFWLHSLPERMSHGGSQIQFQLVAVLSLLALFTHVHAFWIAALFLALVPVPDFWTPLASMADSLARMATGRFRSPAAEAPSEPAPEVLANYTPVKVEAVPPPTPLEKARSDPRDEIAKTHAPEPSDRHQRQPVSVGGHER
ncbi:hypothetical protein [Mesorhizobium onobrychidis]|uniref:Uncharacterized protein n=1 Tax=Mesorhizobium onobrychidis TaxID=2775404 RepID=A0ABY5QRS6_9HYPH|nr:hypothetical protein [Mesorhizobium onobrychidis]UVC13738.1 hypothetical protein IHQ72_23940 [Mesorhizobium onobrychidis]